MGITKALLDWYDRNRRDFPFRGVEDPYLVLESEIMLQQKQTTKVSGYSVSYKHLTLTTKA